jgi:nucleotide-binding universal stress UspA family protein
MKANRVLLPLDGSTLGEAVLDKAVELARAGAALVLLRAAEARHLVGDPVAAQLEVVHEAELYLGGVAERLRRAGVTRVETCVWYGPAAEAIVEAVRARDTDLILMSSHGRSGLSRLVLGSVAETVLRGTTTPILLIRPSGAPVAAITAGGARPAEVSRV